MAIVAPVTNPTLVSAGSPSSSTSQAAATSSATAAAGEVAYMHGVLVPRPGQPVGGQGGRQAAPDHEPEVAGPGTRDQPRLRGRGEVLDDLHGIDRVLRERPAKRRAQRLEIDRTPDRTLSERGEVGGRDLRCARQESRLVVHRCPTYPVAQGDHFGH